MPEESNWRDSLPEELKESTALKDVKDVASLADQFVNAQSLLGSSIRVPGPDAGEEAVKEFHGKLMEKVPGLIPTPDPENPEVMNSLLKKLGRPDDPAGYEHPDGVDATKMADFAKVAHAAGLTKKQYADVLSAVSGFAQEKKESASQSHLDGIRKLKQEWGITYEDNLQMVGNVMKATGAPDQWHEMAANGEMPADALKWFHEIGKRLGTEGINFDKDESSTRLAPAEAKARADEMINNREGPYWDASHPQHQEYIKRYTELLRAAAAGGL